MAIPDINKDKKFRRKPPTDFASQMLGKIPPQAKELEEAILGAIMLDQNAFVAAAEHLPKPEYFYYDAHQRIYAAMLSMALKNTPIDLLTVVEAMRQREELEMVGGPFFITKLTNAVVSSANIVAHAIIVKQKYIQRELIAMSTEIINEAYEDSTDVLDLLDTAEAKLFKVTNENMRKNFSEINSVITQAMNRIEEMRTRSDEMTGVPSGFPKLDQITNGWQKTDLIILAARPSVGKTAFALNLARFAALNSTKKTPVAFFSLEMSASQLVSRILSAESEIPLEKISRGKLEDHEMVRLNAKGVEKLLNAPIYIDDTGALNIFELRAKCRRLKSKYDVGLIIIDYLQLMSGTADNKFTNREQEISKISRELKSLAKELDVPIIALSQLSREVEKRKETAKIPQLSDLRESGAIEQDADMVMFLYRPEYHQINENAEGESVRGQVEVRIAKHRNGSLDNVRLRALLHIQKFVEDENPSGGGSFGEGPGGNFRPIKPTGNSGSGGTVDGFIVQGSKMNSNDFEDEEF